MLSDPLPVLVTDVLPQVTVLELCLFKLGLDHVPNGDQANQPSAYDDGQMANTIVLQDAHDILNVVIWGSDDQFGGHDFSNSC